MLYRTQATAIGGRTGAVATADGSFRLALATPRELGGKGGSGTNPEQLFAAAYASCFLASLRIVGQEKGIRITEDTNVTATVGIGRQEDDQMALDVVLEIDLPDLDPKEAEALAEQAHAICPYSKAVGGNISVRIRVP